jgi:hypothetical protein
VEDLWDVVMWRVVVDNDIDCFETFDTDDPLLAVLWGIAWLRGPCRSGAGEIYRVG